MAVAHGAESLLEEFVCWEICLVAKEQIVLGFVDQKSPPEARDNERLARDVLVS